MNFIEMKNKTAKAVSIVGYIIIAICLIACLMSFGSDDYEDAIFSISPIFYIFSCLPAFIFFGIAEMIEQQYKNNLLMLKLLKDEKIKDNDKKIEQTVDCKNIENIESTKNK